MNAEEFAKKMADTLKQERLKRGISHEQLATACGLTRPAISHIESGKRVPSIQNVYRIVTAMDMTMGEFIGLVESD